MIQKLRWGLCLTVLVSGAAVVQAQEVSPAPDPAYALPMQPQTPAYDPNYFSTAPSPWQYSSGGLDPESLPAEIAEVVSPTPSPRPYGPTPVANVRFLMDQLGLANLFGDSGIRAFGWVEGGYTGSSSGSGLMSVQPRQSRFGNEFLLNQIGLVLQKPLKQDEFDLGFNIRYFAGADAALGQPRGGIDYPPGNPRFSQDFRDLFVSAHLPILTEKGVNIQVGRMNTIIGYNGFLAPYRPFYSSDYQFFYSQDGAFTGALAQVVISDQLDVWSGVTLGANTFFEKRSSNSVCYIGQVNYWVQEEKRTRLTGSIYAGPNAIFAAPGLAGDFDTIVELRIQQNWTDRFMQVVQSNMGWDTNTAVGLGSWYSVYTIGIYHLTEMWDVMGRVEWFRDVRGTRTGFATDYSEVTLGLNWHPTTFLEVRPEIRGDFAGMRVYGTGGPPTDRNQLTGAVSALIKF